MPLRGVSSCLALAFFVAGCVAHAPLGGQYDGPRELPAELADKFAYEPVSSTPESDELRERRSFVVREVSLPPLSDRTTLVATAKAAGATRTAAGASRGAAGATREDELSFEYFDVVGTDVTPVVVLLPILNGNLFVSRYFARYFASHGWAAIVVDRLRDPLDDELKNTERMIRRNITDYRRVLDWVVANPELETNDIGVFGISFGGMDAVMLAALDDRIDAVVAAMAGGDFPYLVMNTSYRGVSRQVHRLLEESGLSRDSMEKRIDSLIETDPLALAPYVDAEDVLLVMTRSDNIVPFESQEALRDRLGEPETLYLPTGHRTSVVYFPLLRSSAYDFFTKQFDTPR